MAKLTKDLAILCDDHSGNTDYVHIRNLIRKGAVFKDNLIL